MTPTVLMISKSTVDFTSLLKATKELLGRSISQGLDSVNIEVKDLASFVCILDEFMSEASNPLTSLRDAGDLLKHIHFVFLVIMDHILYVELLETSGLSFSTTTTIQPSIVASIVSGTLIEWRTAVINMSTGRESYFARIAMNAIMKSIERAGLSGLWSNYRKDVMVDSTIKLIPRA